MFCGFLTLEFNLPPCSQIILILCIEYVKSNFNAYELSQWYALSMKDKEKVYVYVRHVYVHVHMWEINA